jgi:hypothetical protein
MNVPSQTASVGFKKVTKRIHAAISLLDRYRLSGNLGCGGQNLKLASIHPLSMSSESVEPSGCSPLRLELLVLNCLNGKLQNMHFIGDNVTDCCSFVKGFNMAFLLHNLNRISLFHFLY